MRGVPDYNEHGLTLGGEGPDPCEQGWYTYVDKLEKFANNLFEELKDELHLRSYKADIRFRKEDSYIDLILDPIFADDLYTGEGDTMDRSDAYEREGAEKIKAAAERLLPKPDTYEPEFTLDEDISFDGSMWTIVLLTDDEDSMWEEPEYEPDKDDWYDLYAD